MPVVTCPYCRSATATAPCQACGALLPPLKPVSRFETRVAFGMIATLVSVTVGVGCVCLSTKTGPNPVGLYVAAIGAAMAALWLIGRAFGARH